MDERFLRAGAILGAEAMEKLRASHVAVLGLGGVGSWCAEALARCGVGALTVMDEDRVSLTNVNRQAIAMGSTLGRPKAEVMAARIRDIAPDCAVRPVVGRYDASSREAFFSARYDYIADAIDLVACKLDLICTAIERGVPIVSALGTGNKLDAMQLRICDISKTEGDGRGAVGDVLHLPGLARVVRKELRARGVTHHTVVYSPELSAGAAQLEAPPPGRRSVPGSLVWVPASAGLLMCQHIVTQLIKTP